METTSGEREQRLRKNLEQIVAALTTNYHPQQIILFGSLASGIVSPISDLDLLIVKETDKKFWDRMREVVSLCDYDVGVDFLVYTPAELAEETKANLFLKEEILAKGKVIYRAAA